MTPDEEDAKPSFADLIGETRPIRGKSKAVAPIPAPPGPRGRPRAGSDEPAPTKGRFRWPDPERPHLAASPGVSDRQLADLARGDPPPEERIDLHGVRADAAKRLLAQRLASAASRGLGCVIVIHGKGTQSADGGSILRERMPDWLTDSTAAATVRAFAPAPARLGGAGATLVLLKQITSRG
jgi:DNA-nicking Smr family endonuclease